MTTGWTATTLGKVADFLSGGTPSKDNTVYWGGEIPWVSAKGMKRLHLDDSEDHVTRQAVQNGTKVVPKNTVFLLTRGMTLLNDVPISIAARPMAFNQDVKALRPRAGVREDFLPYLLLGHKPRLLDLVDLAGHGTGRLNTDELKSLEVLLPPEDEQHAIAHILGTLDDKIELNRRMNETLEAMARALFKSWFVDFDPVRAKAEGRDPGLPARLADLFPDSFEDSELGEIPTGWDVTTVGEALTAVGGGTPGTKEPSFWDGGKYNWATPKDMSSLSGPILLDTERQVTEAGLGEISSGLLPAGTVLLSSRAPVGYLALAAKPTAINQGFIAMLCDGRVANYYALNWCHFNMDDIKQRASGTTFAEISKATFRPMPMIVPEAGLMQRFYELVGPLYKSIEERLQENRTLAALRDTLLPKLVSGGLRVRGVDTPPTGDGA